MCPILTMGSIARVIGEMDGLMPAMVASACQQRVPPLTGQPEQASAAHLVWLSILAEAVKNGPAAKAEAPISRRIVVGPM